ncbi:MAG TPA: hypothetical protein VLE45_06260, partial [Burkholderiaceae bacterium]|nr:hypothetical protein [Burkholderiaceae bacterium]
IPAAAPATSIRGPIAWATLGAAIAAVVVVAVMLWWLPKQQPTPVTNPPDKPLVDPQGAEAARRELEAQQKKEKEAVEQERKRAEDQAHREAEAQKKAEAERARHEAAAQKKAEADRARLDAQARKKAKADRADAQRRREEELRRAEEAKRAEDAKRASAAATAAAVPKPPVPSAPATADLLVQAEAAAKRGNDAESLALYRKAATAGNAEAQYRLGEIYAAGRGVPQNNSQAYIWLSLAANGGHAGAKARREQVAGSLQPAEIRQADQVVSKLGRSMQR